MPAAEEDAVNLRAYSHTLKCVSMTGELLELPTKDLYQKVKPHDDSWVILNRSAKIKDYNVLKSLSKRGKLIQRNAEESKNLIKDDEESKKNTFLANIVGYD